MKSLNKQNSGFSLLILCALYCVPMLPQAQDVAPKLYMGFGLGGAKDDTCDDLEEAGFNCDGSDVAPSLNGFIGYQPHKNFAFEGGVAVAFGDYDIVTGGGAEIEADFDWRSVFLAVKGNLPIGERMGLYGRVGVHRWDWDLEVESVEFSDDGISWMAGGGFEWHWSEKVSARLDVTHYEADGGHNRPLTLNILWRF